MSRRLPPRGARAFVLAGLLLTGTLSTLTGCGMADDNSPGPSASGDQQSPDGQIPFAGISSTEKAVAAVKQVSSQIYDFTGVPGEASQPGPGVRECQGRDPERYFTVHHPWNFAPKSPQDIDKAAENLKSKLNSGGWQIKKNFRDNSPNANLNLVADNDEKKVSVWVIVQAKDPRPNLNITLTSGCYESPEGEPVEHS